MIRVKNCVRMPFRIDLVMGGVSDLDFWNDRRGGCLSLACEISEKAIKITGALASDSYIRLKGIGGEEGLCYSANEFMSIAIQKVNEDAKMAVAAMQVALNKAESLGADIRSGISVESKSARQKGLGGSSTFAASMISLILGLYGFPQPSLHDTVELVNLAEILCGSNGGWEDVAGAYYQGINRITYDPERIPHLKVESCTDTDSSVGYLKDNLILADTGIPAATGEILAEAYKMFKSNNGLVVRATKNILLECDYMLEALQSGNMQLVGKSLTRQRREWEIITSGTSACIPLESKLAKIAHDIYGFREAGAGGGGTVLIVCKESRKKAVEYSLKEMGIAPLEWDVASYGLEVFNINDSMIEV